MGGGGRLRRRSVKEQQTQRQRAEQLQKAEKKLEAQASCGLCVRVCVLMW